MKMPSAMDLGFVLGDADPVMTAFLTHRITMAMSSAASLTVDETMSVSVCYTIRDSWIPDCAGDTDNWSVRLQMVDDITAEVIVTFK